MQGDANEQPNETREVLFSSRFDRWGVVSRAYFPAACQMSSVPVEVIISDPASYEEKRARIIADGGSNLQVGSLHSYVDQSHALTCASTRFFR